MTTLPLLYAATLFVSAFLLFCIQPLVGKMLLPLLGGTPAVWNTCMVFYQAVLLAGYGYAHFSSRRLRPHVQVLVHLLVLLVPFFFLPIAISEATLRSVPGTSDSPVFWLLGTLVMLAGLPFFAVSTSAPLLQKWFAQCSHEASGDPYFLYAASNLGSMMGLLTFPLFMEPLLRLGEQSSIWYIGYGVLFGLVVACAVPYWKKSAAIAPAAVADDGVEITGRRRLHWTLLAFIPSSLMLGVTTYVSTNVAPLPLLWIIPLALYLLSFILVFAPKPLFSVAAMDHVLYLVAIPVTVSMVANAVLLPWLILPMHFLLFFAASMVCHGRLAEDRPSPSHLTEFFLWMSVGGVLGGLFNALVAPLAFRSLIEYPILIVLACAFRPAPSAERSVVKRDLVLPAALGVATLAMVLAVRRLGVDPAPAVVLMVLGVPAMICFAFVRRPIRFALGIAVLFVARSAYQSPQRETLVHDRDFFGVVKVVRDNPKGFVELVHGDTIHGRQSLDPALRHRPLAYFHPSGPIGHVFAVFNAGDGAPRVAVLGLGVGAMAAYAKPNQDWWMYEIDPAVDRIARDERYFTFLKDSAAHHIEIVLGDGRLKLREAADHSFGLIVLDAFSSDSVPVHLVTRQAIELYLSKLAPGGILAFNVSNRFLDFKEMLGAVAGNVSLHAWFSEDLDVAGKENHGKEQSRWVVMARSPGDVAPLIADPRWREIGGGGSMARAFSDDFSNILSVIRWF